MQNETRTTLIGFLFVVSGLLGLVYQIVWFKYLSSFLGNTTYAQSIVLATFMGGMAIGATLWGRQADRIQAHLAIYGWLEIAIGIFCAVYPVLLEVVRGFFLAALIDLGWTGESSGVLFAKAIVSVVILLPPTILMGGTLPILVRAMTRRFEQAGEMIAILYALNSLGAVIGALLGGFFMIRLVGLQATILVAASLSVLVGAAALILSRREAVPAVSPDPAMEPQVYSRHQGLIATIVAGLSGAAAMILEVTWVRMLIPVLGSSTHSFSIMLVAFITGITLGGLYAARLMERSRSLMRWLASAQTGIIVSVAATLLLYDRLPYLVWKASSVFSRDESTYPLFLILQFVFCFLWMVVPTFFFGVSLPIAIRIASHSTETLGSSVGRVYTVNTAGTVAGSLLAGFILIPLLGTYGAVLAAIVLLGASAAIIVLNDPESVTARGKMVLAGAVLLSLTASAVFRGDMILPSLSGVFRLINKNISPPASFSEFVSKYADTDVLFYREGVSATVAVVGSKSTSDPEHILIINGKADASSRTDMPTQKLLGHLPALLHPNPKHALIIGYGSGATAAGLLKHPLERLDCVEISPEVIEASPFFEDVNEDPLSDERFHVAIDDASSFVAISPVQYDVIVSEPSNPWIAGIGSLYTQEFLRECMERMTPDGVMSQWFHLYEMDDEIFQLVVRTFASVFPSVTIWESISSADVILIGSLQPIDIDEAALRDRIARPGVEQDLRRIGLSDALTLLSVQVMSDRNIRSYSGDGLLNTEDHPLLEFMAPRAFFVNRGVTGIGSRDERLIHPRPDTYLMRHIRNVPLSDESIRQIGLYHANPQVGQSRLGFRLLNDYLRRQPADRKILRTLVRLSDAMGRLEDKVNYLRTLATADPNDHESQSLYGWALFEDHLRNGSILDGKIPTEAESHIRRAIALVGDTVDRYRVGLADIFFTTGRYALAMDQYARAIQIRESHTGDPYISADKLYARLAKCLYETGDLNRSFGYALRATTINPANQEARQLIATLMWTGTEPPTDERSR